MYTNLNIYAVFISVRLVRRYSRALILALAFPVSASVLPAQVSGETKVVSHTYNNYTRTVLADGSYKPETYVFTYGDIVDEEPIANDSMDSIGFDEVARLVATALKTKGYISNSNPDTTQQVIMLWYGNTRRTVAKPTAYELIESRNVRILGFQREQSAANKLSFTTIAQDFYEEFQAGRYFVVLKAYDFQVARKEKRLKLLWESRFSILRQANDFQTELPKMAQFAARTFGKETNGIFNPSSIKGEVKLGELKILGEIPSTGKK
ncbi:MAG: hypothetical protein ABI273_07475 [Lacunisphaera sp.]